MTSLRAQLTRGLLGGGAVLLALVGGLLYWSTSSALVAEFDEALGAKATALASLLELDEDFIEFDYSAEAMPEYEGGDDPEAFVLWFDDGSEATRSATLDGHEALPRRYGTLAAPEIWDLPLADGRPGRALGVEVPVHPDELPEGSALVDLPRVVIVVARSRGALDGRLAGLRDLLLLSSLGALLMGWWGVTLCVRRGLEPLRRLGAEVERLDASSLGARRLASDQVPAEVLPFVERLDQLFERVQGSFEQQRRMTAAMAHELRTPIAELRSASDVAGRWPDDAELRADLLSTADDVALRMTGAVDAVMHYCRLVSGEDQARPEAVRLGALLDGLWAPHAEAAAARGVTLANDVRPDVVACVDRGLVTIMLGNLLQNAASFSAPGEVRLTCEPTGERLALELANPCDDLDPDDLERLSEPFWRKDPARSNGRHSGLGLALVASIAELLGRRATFALADGRYRVRVELLASPAVIDERVHAPGPGGSGAG